MQNLVPCAAAASAQLLTLVAVMVSRVSPVTSGEIWVSVHAFVFACLCVSLGSIYLASSRMALPCPRTFAGSDREL